MEINVEGENVTDDPFWRKLFQPMLLLEGDDWSFVIKTHAALEAAMTEMLVAKIGDPRLTAFFEQLPLSDSKIGKVAVAKSLDLLAENERRFLRTYSELRNSLVHKVANIEFSFQEYFQKLGKDALRNWKDNLFSFAGSDETRANWLATFEKAPKAIFAPVIAQFLLRCSLHEHLAVLSKNLGRTVTLEEAARHVEAGTMPSDL